MDPRAQEAWQDEALDFVLLAVGGADELRGSLVFRGARILYHHLGRPRRASLDLDAVLSVPAADVDRAVLEEQFLRALGVPTLTMDLAAPEQFGAGAVERREMGVGYVLVCSNHNLIAGKLRAFLESTALHRAKLTLPGRPLRVKDLVDLARAWDVYRDEPSAFWRAVAGHLEVGCRSRLVDCAGWTTFASLSDAAMQAYQADPATANSSYDFAEAWQRLESLVGRLAGLDLFPIIVPLPSTAKDS